jgi:hypothetical protein
MSKDPEATFEWICYVDKSVANIAFLWIRTKHAYTV